jgi:hypothetical protein
MTPRPTPRPLHRAMHRWGLALPLLLALAACGGRHAPQAATGPQQVGPYPPSAADAHVPSFAARPYQGFVREDAIAIALREWRLFGSRVDDDPPGSRPPPAPEDKPERQPGLWERVGDYWWLGQDAGSRFADWTGKHDESGVEFPAGRDANFAWSAAFISYVMRIDGAGPRFPYAIAHSTYINAARTGGYAITAMRPTDYAPVPGDLICEGRTRRPLTYDDLPTDASFPGHCDIVVAAVPGQLTVIGGNVDDAVTMKHVPTDESGKLAEPDGRIIDTRYPWFVVIRVNYDR